MAVISAGRIVRAAGQGIVGTLDKSASDQPHQVKKKMTETDQFDHHCPDGMR